MRLTATPARIDVPALLARTDLTAIITADRGAPNRERKWLCPFHDDHHPSLGLSRDGRRFRCWACGTKGNALDWIMLRDGLTFIEAARSLEGAQKRPFATATKAASKPATPPPAPRKAEPSGLPREAAEGLLEASVARLWNDEGKAALAYLEARGLAPETIKAARLGYVPSVSIPTAAGDRFFQASGITIPWIGKGGKLAAIKIRQGQGKQPKYVQAFHCPTVATGIFPSAEAIKPGRPLIVTEGEFDCLLLAQELAGLASFVTLGGASNRPTGPTLAAMLAASPWYIATDNDPAGDRAAEGWPARARRVRPPEGDKDWTDCHRGGFNRLRYWWLPLLGGEPDPATFTEEWGPQPDPTEAALDPYALAEREAIQAEGSIVMEADAGDRYSGSGNGTAGTAPPHDPQTL